MKARRPRPPSRVPPEPCHFIISTPYTSLAPLARSLPNLVLKMVNFGCGLWFRRSKAVDQTPALEAPRILDGEKVSEADKEDLLGEGWQSDFAIRVQKASKTHFSRLQRLSEESNLHSALVVLQTEYQQRAIPLNLAKWEPVLEAMDSFTIGINQLMQASPSACNFLWGSILLLLQVRKDNHHSSRARL